MQNIATYKLGKKLFISIDLSRNSGKTLSGKSINVATSCGYRPLAEDHNLRLKLHLYQRPENSTPESLTASAQAEPADASIADINQILAVASGLTNENRRDLIDFLQQMIVRDSLC